MFGHSDINQAGKISPCQCCHTAKSRFANPAANAMCICGKGRNLIASRFKKPVASWHYFNYYAVPRHRLPVMVGDIQLLAADTLRQFRGIPADERNEAPGLKFGDSERLFSFVTQWGRKQI